MKLIQQTEAYVMDYQFVMKVLKIYNKLKSGH